VASGQAATVARLVAARGLRARAVGRSAGTLRLARSTPLVAAAVGRSLAAVATLARVFDLARLVAVGRAIARARLLTGTPRPVVAPLRVELDCPARLVTEAGATLRLVDTVWRLRLEPEPVVTVAPPPRAIPEPAHALRVAGAVALRPDGAYALRLELVGWRLRLEDDTTLEPTDDRQLLVLSQ
jgi:2-keto-4-pentenoate hydratase/2-oxohepta-3-ene-1,7-dioic acid hydratase in catechol pathway